MINWDEHREIIIALSRQGMSSTEICDVISTENNNVDRTKARGVRRVVKKAREDGRLPSKGSKGHPKVLVFDIESAPMQAYIWQLKTRYVNKSNIIKDWYAICWSAKWLFSEEVINDCVTVEESKQRDDERIVRSMWDAMDKADWIIAHNGDRFDIKMMNSRFAKYDLDLPSPYMSIDTYKEAKKSFRLPSYSLDYIAKHFGVQQKDKTEFAMWKEENLEDADNLARMSSYCDNDVKVLEDVYFNMRSYIKSHPNFGLFKVSEKACC